VLLFVVETLDELRSGEQGIQGVLAAAGWRAIYGGLLTAGREEDKIDWIARSKLSRIIGLAI